MYHFKEFFKDVISSNVFFQLNIYTDIHTVTVLSWNTKYQVLVHTKIMRYDQEYHELTNIDSINKIKQN